MKKLHLVIHDDLPIDKVMERVGKDVPIYVHLHDYPNIVCHVLKDESSYDGMMLEIYHGRGLDLALYIQEVKK